MQQAMFNTLSEAYHTVTFQRGIAHSLHVSLHADHVVGCASCLFHPRAVSRGIQCMSPQQDILLCRGGVLQQLLGGRVNVVVPTPNCT